MPISLNSTALPKRALPMVVIGVIGGPLAGITLRLITLSVKHSIRVQYKVWRKGRLIGNSTRRPEFAPDDGHALSS